MFSYAIITIGFLYLLLIVVILPLKLRNQKKNIDRNIFDSFLDEDHVFFWSKKKDKEKQVSCIMRESYKNVSRVYTKWFFIIIIVFWLGLIVYNLFVGQFYIAVGHIIAVLLLSIAGLGKMRFKQFLLEEVIFHEFLSKFQCLCS